MVDGSVSVAGEPFCRVHLQTLQSKMADSVRRKTSINRREIEARWTISRVSYYLDGKSNQTSITSPSFLRFQLANWEMDVELSISKDTKDVEVTAVFKKMSKDLPVIVPVVKVCLVPTTGEPHWETLSLTESTDEVHTLKAVLLKEDEFKKNQENWITNDKVRLHFTVMKQWLEHSFY